MSRCIGIIGGSGIYELLKKGENIKVKTPYGFPSDGITVGKIGKVNVAFLPRHGGHHQFPPHKIPYKANLWALKKLGVSQIISLTACGSLQKEIKRGELVIIDQFVDRTSGRAATFFDGPKTVHISTAYPYCPRLCEIAYKTGKKIDLPIRPSGTLVVVEGPRFSSFAESSWFTKMNWEIINMTGYPEISLAKELEMCYCSIGLVTDYDVGIVASSKLPPVSTSEIIKVFSQNIEKAKKLVSAMVDQMTKRDCDCRESLKGAKIN